jgi:hypothetical protein
MANRDILTAMKDSDGVSVAAAQTATFKSETYSLSGLEYFGIIVDLGTVTGTTPTLVITVQLSVDGGTTWLDTYPDGANSATQAALASMNTNIETAEYWLNILPNDNNAVVRFNFTIGGTSPSFTITNAYFVARRFGKY